MFFRLIREFTHDSQAGISLMTICLMPLFLILIYTSYDFGRYFTMTRFVSSAAQQTVEWVANRGVLTGEDPSAVAKEAFDARMGRNMIAITSLSNGITATNETFTYDSGTGTSRLVAKVKYNLALRKTLGLDSFLITADARIKLYPVFATIVFSSGEMRSEGDYIYGNQQTGSLSPNRGVSWSNNYYTDVIGTTVATRTTPTHNYYVVSALAKQLAQRFVFRQLFINIIPVSATINLNPLDASATPRGSREGKLPPWIFADTGFQFDNTSNANPINPYCITNRSFPPGTPKGSFYPDYYHVQGSDISSAIAVNSNNFFTHDELLIDSSLIFNVNEGTNNDIDNSKAFYTRGYPYSSLINSSKCPATNSTPALATFQQVTTNDYTADASQVIKPTENQIFWDYMRNFIDPAYVTDYAIWGSPNMAFGLQIAYENIGDVQKYGRINNNNTNFDPKSIFLVYMVSDQIGGVKNASGAPMAESATTTTRWSGMSYCLGDRGYGFLISSPCKSDPINLLDLIFNKTNANSKQLPSNESASETTKNFQFTHFWWDNAYNIVDDACFDNGVYSYYACDQIYSATTTSVVRHFYNIINYSLDFKFNKNINLKYVKPKTFFIDTGSGKRDAINCQSSNKNTKKISILSWYYNITKDATHYTESKPCYAYANISGYKSKFNADSLSQIINIFDNFITLSKSYANYESGILPVIYEYYNSYDNAPLNQSGSRLRNSWIGGQWNNSITGFSRIFAYQDTTLDSSASGKNAVDYLPLSFYNINDRLQLNSNTKAPPESTANTKDVNTAKAQIIAKKVVNETLAAPAIISPY